jgi:hypothetical protein
MKRHMHDFRLSGLISLMNAWFYLIRFMFPINIALFVLLLDTPTSLHDIVCSQVLKSVSIDCRSTMSGKLRTDRFIFKRWKNQLLAKKYPLCNSSTKHLAMLGS